MFSPRIYISKHDCDNDWTVLLATIFKIELRREKKLEIYSHIRTARVSHDQKNNNTSLHADK